MKWRTEPRGPAAWLCLWLGLLPTLAMAEAPSPVVAIIIDDMGIHYERESRLIQLEHPLTLAFLPHMPHTRALARHGHAQGKEIMLHIPMANTGYMPLGPGGLKPGMSRDRMVETLQQALISVPYVRGVNNHMGSLLTSMEKPMGWVMEELSRHPLYFVDSRTTAATVAANQAEANDIPHMSRDVFLDHERTEEFLEAQFQRLIDQALNEGTAIAIGHPYEITVRYLEDNLHRLDEKGIAMAPVSALWKWRHNHSQLFEEDDPRSEQETRLHTAEGQLRLTPESRPTVEPVRLSRYRTSTP